VAVYTEDKENHLNEAASQTKRCVVLTSVRHMSVPVWGLEVLTLR